jgi:hypothetical protein
MKCAKFSWRRFAVALGIGFGLEALLFGPILTGLSPALPRWGSGIVELTQEPSMHFVTWLVDQVHPGFEEQVAYLYLVPVIQGLCFSVAIYVALASWNKESARSDR